MPVPPKAFNGGGGLFSTAPDYVLFMQMILHHGRGPNNAQILQPKTVAMMTTNQIGDVSAGKLKTFRPTISSDVDFHPGVTDGFTYGFLINKTAYPGGRSAGSLAWAGVENTFYWIDPSRSLCAVIMMQFFPLRRLAGGRAAGRFRESRLRGLIGVSPLRLPQLSRIAFGIVQERQSVRSGSVPDPLRRKCPRPAAGPASPRCSTRKLIIQTLPAAPRGFCECLFAREYDHFTCHNETPASGTFLNKFEAPAFDRREFPAIAVPGPRNDPRAVNRRQPRRNEANLVDRYDLLSDAGL